MPSNADFIAIRMPTTAGGTDDVIYSIWPHAVVGRITALRFVPEVNVTAHDTNNTDLSVEVDGTEIASEVTSTGDTGNLTAGTDIAFAITGTAAQCELSQNSVIAFKKTDGGTGVSAGGTLVATVSLDKLGA